MEVEMFGIERSNGEHQRKPAPLEESHAVRCLSMNRRYRAKPETRSCGVLVDQTFSAPAATTRSTSTFASFLDCAQPGRGDRRGRFPRGSLPSAVGSGRSRAAAVGAPRGYSRADRYFMTRFRSRPAAETPDRPGCDGGMQSHVCWKRPAASQQCRARHDPRGRRPGSDHQPQICCQQGRGLHGAAMPTSSNGEHIMGLPLREGTGKCSSATT